MQIIAWLVIGLVAAAAYTRYVARQGKAEQRLLALGLIIAAFIYVGMAIWQRDDTWLGIEIAGAVAYTLPALAGLRGKPHWIAIGWFLHPLWDIILHYMGPGHHIVPGWYAWACVSFDVWVGAYILQRNWKH